MRDLIEGLIAANDRIRELEAENERLRTDFAGAYDKLAKENDANLRLMAEDAILKDELEVERMRLAACGTAALGYFEGCKDEYKSASLDDVLRLYTENSTLREALKKENEV